MMTLSARLALILMLDSMRHSIPCWALIFPVTRCRDDLAAAYSKVGLLCVFARCRRRVVCGRRVLAIGVLACQYRRLWMSGMLFLMAVGSVANSALLKVGAP